MGFCIRTGMEIEIGGKMGLSRGMQIKLSYKLFAAFFLILAIVVGALFLSRYLFSLNFKRYIHHHEPRDVRNPQLYGNHQSSPGSHSHGGRDV